MARDQGMVTATIAGRRTSVTPDQYKRAQELFLQAVDIDVRERTEWIEKHCAGDAQLKRAVEGLLTHDDPRTLLTKLDPTIKTTLGVAAAPASRPLAKLWRWLVAMPRAAQLALAALAVILPVLIAALAIDHVTESFRKQVRVAALSELVEAKANAVQLWLEREQSISQTWADSPEVRRMVAELVAVAAAAPEDSLAMALIDSPQQLELEHELHDLSGLDLRYAVWNRNLVTIADWSAEKTGVGVGVTPDGAARLTHVIDGQSEVVILSSADVITRNYPGVPGKPQLAMFLPVRNEANTVIAAMLVYGTQREDELLRFVHLSSGIDGAATLVFDRGGCLLLESPYNQQLRELGLLPKDPTTFSAKRLVLRDPGVDLTAGKVPAEPLDSRPLTKLVRMASRVGSGVDADGYRDVRGVWVVGGWQWLDEYNCGIGIEIEKAWLEPDRWLYRTAMETLLSTLAACLGVIAYSLFTIGRLQNRVAAAHRIGPYVLERMIGEGGMGYVYLARHDLLKRRTAIKLLRPEVTDNNNLQRFQREALLAAKLEHPNTICVYDFGVSPDHLFYLVMEWIDGVTLDQLVSQQGPVAVDRCIRLLCQIAMSLREAHLIGLIHRDLKPQNIMVAQRAGETDVVKVLDFGLAREVVGGGNKSLTAIGLVAGTPRYMAPERWQPAATLGPAVDIYAFGCIAFFMLTGRHALAGDSIDEICQASLAQPTPRASQYAAQVIPAGLDDLIVHCLDKDPQRRPASFDAILYRLRSTNNVSTESALSSTGSSIS